MSMPVSSVLTAWMMPAMSPSLISLMAQPVERSSSSSAAWRGRSSMQAVISLTGTPLALASDSMFSRGLMSRSTVPSAIAGADGDLLHVDVGRVEQAAALGHGEDADRIRLVLGAEGRAFERIDGDIDLRALAGADFLADEQHRRFVALALADDDAAVDVDVAEFGAHGLDGGVVGGLLVALAAPVGGGDRGALGDAHQLERQGAVR